MALPLIEIVHFEGEMIVFIGWGGGVRFFDQVQFLARTQTKPGAGESECRAGNWFELQHAAVKFIAARYIGNVNSDVIQSSDCHRGYSALPSKRKMKVHA